MQIWQAVQDQLNINRQGQKTKATSVNPSLLSGLLWDANGVNLTPTHAKKGSIRYRYYTSSQVAQNNQTSTQRWPAQPLEEVVISYLTQFLNDESKLIDYLNIMPAGQIQQHLKTAAAQARELETAHLPRKIELLQKLIDRITVSDSDITLSVKVDALSAQQKDSQHQDKQTATIQIPVQLKRCGMAVRLIVKSSEYNNKRKRDPKLITRMVKAYDWFERLTSVVRTASSPLLKKSELAVLM